MMSTRMGLDCVDGIIVDGGSFERRATIYNIRGVKQHGFYFSGDDNPVAIAEAWIAAKKKEIGEDEFFRLWPEGLDVRIYD